MFVWMTGGSGKDIPECKMVETKKKKEWGMKKKNMLKADIKKHFWYAK